MFDVRDCKYPDRTLSSLPIKDRLQVNLSIKNPIYIDIKNDRTRAEDRQHLSKKLKRGYPVERITGKADVPTYQKTRATQSILSTLSEPSDLLIGERNSSTVTSKINDAGKSALPSSTTKSSSILEIPSTLSGPSGLLIGERNSNNPKNMPKQIKNLSSFQRKDKQNTLLNENRKSPSTNKGIEQSLLQENRQSTIFDEGEEVLLNTDRRVLIKDKFYQEKGSVFDRLGPKVKTKTYSEVVGGQEEYVRQPDSHKRINSDIPGPSKRVSSSQATIAHTKESSVNTPKHHLVQSAHDLTTPAKALLPTSMSMNTSVRTGAPY